MASMLEEILAALDNKNPAVKEETCKFLIRTFQICTPAVLKKDILKQLIPAVIKVSVLYKIDFDLGFTLLNVPFQKGRISFPGNGLKVDWRFCFLRNDTQKGDQK